MSRIVAAMTDYLQPTKQIRTVSELTADIQQLLEDKLPFVWLSGEISNFSAPASGHFYFTVKDDHAQIRGVMFRSQNRTLRFRPENGLSIVGLGRIGVYAPRGVYQIIFEYVEPSGLGAVQAAFEQLKEKLSKEGLFDPGFKQPLPVLPHHVCLVTSPTGAVVHDVIRIALGRYPNLAIQVIPVTVQGDASEDDIVRAISLANDRVSPDVVILARGGGSLEDLQAFNSEAVARAIFASNVPIVSAVGHETDFTIADFVADLRAPTPSAAAEMCVPLRRDLERQIQQGRHSLTGFMLGLLDRQRDLAEESGNRLMRVHPLKKIEDLRLLLDDHTTRMGRSFLGLLAYFRERLEWLTHRLLRQSPILIINNYKEYMNVISYNLNYNIKLIVERLGHRVREAAAMLGAMNPENILARGYSITRIRPGGRILRHAKDASIEQHLDITLSKGSVTAQVLGRHLPGATAQQNRNENGSETDI